MADKQPPAIQNPLAGILIGSRVNGETGTINVPVLNAHITQFIDLPSTSFRLTGVSSYMNSADMNQGSLSVSGSYGISGIAKISGALTVVGSESTQESVKTISLGMNYIKWAGAEYIDFENLHPAQLLAALDDAAQAAMLEVLGHFHKLLDLTKDMTPAQVRAALDDTAPDTKAIRFQCKAWAQASASFRSRFGDGIVAAVLWGGWGAVGTTITSANNQTTWSIAGSGNFEAQGDGADVKISASYGHQEAMIGSTASADVVGYSNGACVEQMVNQWTTNLSADARTSITAIGDDAVKDDTALQALINKPNIPGFQAPNPLQNPAVAALPLLYASLAQSGQLGALSSACAWHQGGSTTTLSDFLTQAAKPSGADAAFAPILDTTAPITPASGSSAPLPAGHLGLRHVRAADVAARAQQTQTQGPGPDFEPMGVWITGWANLFPWLCSGQQNSLPADAAPKYSVALKVMHQDMVTLATLYARYASCGIQPPSYDPIDYTQISGEFATAAATVSSYLTGEHPGDGAAEAKAVLEQVLHGLGPSASAIYQVWDSNGFLRNANLGLGVLITEDDGNGETAYQMLETMWTDASHNNLIRLNWSTTDFAETSENYEVFAQGAKATPLILPEGTTFLVVTGTPADPKDTHDYTGYLTSVPDPTGGKADWLGLSKNVDDAVVCNFVTGSGPSKLVNAFGSHAPVTAYPLPFSAASSGLPWSGTSASTGMGDIVETLKTICAELNGMNAWSFDNDLWPAHALNTTYSLANITLHYYGVVAEPPNMLPSVMQASRGSTGGHEPV